MVYELVTWWNWKKYFGEFKPHSLKYTLNGEWLNESQLQAY